MVTITDLDSEILLTKQCHECKDTGTKTDAQGQACTMCAGSGRVGEKYVQVRALIADAE